mmetsp:Transcript_11054/g.29923  ORF Transcript_11054/g.29923 Transcript_11054/m.29923 type:complete len:239 (+) Transcript_11054:24-740(+)
MVRAVKECAVHRDMGPGHRWCVKQEDNTPKCVPCKYHLHTHRNGRVACSLRRRLPRALWPKPLPKARAFSKAQHPHIVESLEALHKAPMHKHCVVKQWCCGVTLPRTRPVEVSICPRDALCAPWRRLRAHPFELQRGTAWLCTPRARLRRDIATVNIATVNACTRRLAAHRLGTRAQLEQADVVQDARGAATSKKYDEYWARALRPCTHAVADQAGRVAASCGEAGALNLWLRPHAPR